MKRTYGLLAFISFVFTINAVAFDTSFTYQGRLSDSNGVVNGVYDLRFQLFDAVTNGAQLGNTATNAAVAVTNGLFRVHLEFGSAPFVSPANTSAAWLQIGVRTGASSSDFTELSPRQQLGVVPYAVQANSASSYSGPIQTTQLPAEVARLDANQTFSGTLTAASFIGSGAGLTSLNASALTGGSVTAALLLNNTANNMVASNVASPVFTSRAAGETLTLKAANGSGNGGALNIHAGDAGAGTGGGGGNLTLQAGSAVPQGGVGYANQGPAGVLTLNGGAGYNGVGGNVIVRSGPNSPWSLTSDGYSKVSLQGGTLNNGDGAIIEAEGGHNINSSGSSFSRGGNVRITTGNGVGSYPAGNILLLPGTGVPNGAVGIGKSNPAATLDVNGPIMGLSFAASNLTSRTAGEPLQIKAANGVGTGGPLTVAAGDAGAGTGGAGGNLTLQAGSAVPQGGSGYFNQGPAGVVTIKAGGGYNGVGGDIVMQSGPNSPWSLTPDGFSKLTLQGGTLNAGDGAVLEVEGGHNINSSGGSISRGGNVRITTGNGVGGHAAGNILLLPGAGTPAGRVGIGVSNPSTLLQVGSATCDGSTWVNSSDRNLKENFTAVDGREVLAKVASLPITRWNYKAQPNQEHVGPVAQDFAAAFRLGSDDKHIATVDSAGIAFAAIQGLNDVVTKQAADLKEKQAQIDSLQRRLDQLEEILQSHRAQ